MHFSTFVTRLKKNVFPFMTTQLCEDVEKCGKLLFYVTKAHLSHKIFSRICLCTEKNFNNDLNSYFHSTSY